MTGTNTIDKYLTLIKHNLSLLDLLAGKLPSHLKDEDFSDWKVTILFYMSCIYLKAVCSLFGENIEDHYTLKQLINTRTEFGLTSIATPYRHLEEASRDARYEGRTFKKNDILTRLVPKFNTVRDCVVDILKKHNISNIPSIDPEALLKR